MHANLNMRGTVHSRSDAASPTPTTTRTPRELADALGPTVCALLAAGDRKAAITLVEAGNDEAQLSALALVLRAQLDVALLRFYAQRDAHRARVVARRRIVPADAGRWRAAVESVAAVAAQRFVP
jgi:hypothetical protein